MTILPPPPQNFVDPESHVKEEIFREVLRELQQLENITVWENPVAQYEADGGQHPSAKQTEVLLQYINVHANQDLGVPYILPSSTGETLTSERFYKQVNALYKYGCAACDSKTQNKWYNLCEECKVALKEDDGIKRGLLKFEEQVKKIEEAWMPQLGITTTTNTEDVCSDGIRSRSPLKAEQHNKENDGKSRRDITFKPYQ